MPPDRLMVIERLIRRLEREQRELDTDIKRLWRWAQWTTYSLNQYMIGGLESESVLRRILIYEEDTEQTAPFASFYDKLKSYLDGEGFDVDLVQASTSGLVLDDYTLIFLSLFDWHGTSTFVASSDTTFWTTNLPGWLDQGGRRLVVMGENSTNWNDPAALFNWDPGINDNLNVLLSGIGSALRLTTTEAADTSGAATVCVSEDSTASGNYLSTGLAIQSDWSAGVTGGNVLFTEDVSGVTWMRSETWSASPNSEIVVAGDTNWAGDNCAYATNADNETFFTRLAESEVP